MMAPFAREVTGGAEIGFSTSSTKHFQQINTTTAHFGPATMSVTNYKANNTPETISECGFSVTITAASLQIGAVPSTNVKILTSEHFEATISGTATDTTLKLISLTQA
jgi:hypothetical protein